MKKMMALAALALAFAPSCSYLSCAFSGNMTSCVVQKSLEQAVSYLTEGAQVNDTASADSFASKWSSIQSAVNAAQGAGVALPSSTISAYNGTVNRMQSNNYYNSSALSAVMQAAQLLK